MFTAASKVMPSSTATSPYFNITDVSSNREQADEWSVRIDQNINARNKITGSYFNGNMPYVSTQSLGSLYTGGNTQGNKYLRLGYDIILKPTMLNHFNAGFTRRHRVEGSGDGGYGGNWATKFGLKGVGDAVFPRFQYNYPANGINTPSDGASAFDDNVFQYDDALSWQKGRHSFRFGGEFRAAQFNLNILTGSAGQFNFTQSPTSTPADNQSGFGFASFYLGAASNAYIDIPQINGWRAKYVAFFGADDWKVSSKLTVNLGLRYDMPIPVTEAQNRMSYVNPTLANPGAGGLPGAYVYEGSGTGRLGGSSPQSIYGKAFGPRLGVAHVGLAQTHARQANDTQALQILAAARAKRPGHYLLEYYFGLLASRLGRDQEAVDALKQAAQLEPNSPDPSFELGKVYASKEDWPEARLAFEHVVELNPQFVAGHYQLRRAYEHLGLRDKAAQEAQKSQALMSKQREDSLRKQREQGMSFQPHASAETSHQP